MSKTELYADILLPLPLQQYYTYRIPPDLKDEVKPGKRVIVHFGSKRFYSGLIVKLYEEPKKSISIKDITEVLDEEPIATEKQFEFWKWLAQYYICSEGELMNAALPAGLKMESKTKYAIHPLFDEDFSRLDDDEYMIAEGIMKHETLSPGDIQAISGKRSVQALIRSLVEKCVIYPQEEINEKYIPKKRIFLSLNKEYTNEGIMNAFLTKLETKAPKQYRAILHFFNLGSGQKEVEKTALVKESTNAAVKALIDKGVLEQYEKTVSRIPVSDETASINDIILSPAQDKAFEEINESFSEEKTALLWGVTGSGKTEIYIKLIEKCFEEGKQALYLLPEIALTGYMVKRLKKYFGSKLLVYHSRFNMHEKVEIWKKVLSAKEPLLIMGARSSVFLPFSYPGLIIVDEEHDYSYKQQDPAPRYHARDAAIMLAKFNKAKVVLGTATPSAESWYNAKEDNYRLVKLMQRFGDAKLPLVHIVDIKEATMRKTMRSYLSPQLFGAMQQTLNDHKQIILFQNRRGYSTWLECNHCGWTPICKNCDVSMTYHKQIDLLKCHYCGYTERVPSECPKCQNTEIQMKGMGTQKAEDELGILFQNTEIARMDMDTVRGKNAHQAILDGFDNGKYQILVGTQMVSKGLDFGRVEVVGILNGDNLHTYPDFRSHESAFQLMMQVAGRAGRRKNPGQVFIQVYDKDNPIVKFVENYDYEGFMEQELASREIYQYPPFYRLLKISIKHKTKEVSLEAGAQLAGILKGFIPEKQVLGPVYPVVARVKNLYIRQILIKLPRLNQLHKLKKRIYDETRLLNNREIFKGCRISIDVDPH
ncbi:MAG: primosomal protein N' [Marinilabiliales bacterium]|nr:MAG: primosomal protein N' [Marinilabiliales bacterium]